MPISQPTQSNVRATLEVLKDPETGRGLVEMDQIPSITVDEGSIQVTLGLTSYAAPLWDDCRKECEELLRRTFPAMTKIEVSVTEHKRPPEKIGEIGLTTKAVIAVGSGKGGVGKSTIASCLAYGLRLAGSRVGLMDADVYGPSIPHLLGVNERPQIVDGRIQPIEFDGVKVMSMGFLVPPGEAVVWRGPMLHGAITQFLRDTQWGPLDYLIIDLPPGTGDIVLTLSQLLPLTGAVVVCTPQEVALLDAVKAIAMFRKVSIPVLGMVENMSYFICPDTLKQYDIFGTGGAKQKAIALEVPFLGEVPINIGLRRRGDEGQLAGNYQDETTAPYLRALYYNLVRNLAEARRANPPLPTLSVL